MRVRVEAQQPGLHPSEAVVKIVTAEGDAVYLTQHRDTVKFDSVEVGYPVDRREGAYLVEFSRELSHGPRRAWIPSTSLLDDNGHAIHAETRIRDQPMSLVDIARMMENLPSDQDMDDLDHILQYERARQRIDGQRIYVDLDGVLANFDDHFSTTFNIHHDDIKDDRMWKHILSIPPFYSDLSPCEGAIEAFRQLERWYGDPIILTACSKRDYENAALRKRAWVRQYISTKVTVLPVLEDSKKYLFMHAPGDILIDDSGSSIDKWIAAYGKGILHEGDWKRTLAMVDLYRRGSLGGANG